MKDFGGWTPFFESDAIVERSKRQDLIYKMFIITTYSKKSDTNAVFSNTSFLYITKQTEGVRNIASYT